LPERDSSVAAPQAEWTYSFNLYNAYIHVEL
jgi:hypothetical protein